MTYEVQTLTPPYGWVSTWMYADDDGRMHPEAFPTREDAQAPLDQFLAHLRDEIAAVTSKVKRRLRIPQPVLPLLRARTASGPVRG